MKNYAAWMADSVIARNTNLTDHWGYEYGLTLDGIYQVWQDTGEKKYLDYISETMNHFITQSGNINGYRADEYNIDHLNNGKIVLRLYKETGLKKYKTAVEHLREQIVSHPRTDEGVFWHKEIYPHQIWLDGLYMGAAFYAAYATAFDEPEAFDDIAKQFIIAEKHLRDPKTGLLFHAWDAKAQQPWADPQTGLSAHFWGRSVGWFVMALVDVLELFPNENPQKQKLVDILQRAVDGLLKVEDKEAHAWYQVLDQGTRKGNYLEASGSSMITYALLKGVRLGFLPKTLKAAALAAFDGLVQEFISPTKNGLINLNKVCYVAGLGGKDKRDGSFAYYISEPIVSNEPKGLGPFIMAAQESERLQKKQGGDIDAAETAIRTKAKIS